MSRGGVARSMLLGAIAGALVIGAGCEGAAPEEEVVGTDLTALYCPMVPTGEQGAGGEEYEPAEDAFDTAELVGLHLDAAREHAAGHGCDVVVSIRDGEGVPVPLEIDPTLIYVYTEDEVVTVVEGVGGGL